MRFFIEAGGLSKPGFAQCPAMPHLPESAVCLLRAAQAEDTCRAWPGRETYQLKCFDPLFQTTILTTLRNGFLHGSDSVRSQHDFLQCLRSVRAMCFLVRISSRNVAQCCGAGFQKVGYVIGACDNMCLCLFVSRVFPCLCLFLDVTLRGHLLCLCVCVCVGAL